MLASASRSAWRPAPLVGSVAATVRTAGRGVSGSFMGGAAGLGGLHLKPVPRCARLPGILTFDAAAKARDAHSTQPSTPSTMSSAAPQKQPFRMWRCLACGLIYDE